METKEIVSKDLQTDDDLTSIFSEICSKVTEQDFVDLYNSRPHHISQENGFAHATEIMQRVREAGLRYVEVPITISYSEYSQQKGQRLSGSLSILFDLIMAKLTK